MMRAHWLNLTRGILAASEDRADPITTPYKGRNEKGSCILERAAP